MFEIKKDPTKVLVCGTGSGWDLIPKQTEKTVYCLNDYIRTERYGIKPDVLFIMDVLDEKPQIVAGVDDLADVIRRINNLKIPFVAPFKYDEIPLSEAFPLEECAKKFGIPYFSNSISYMIAYALLKGAREIETYGVNQSSSAEYFYERAGVEYWLGIANGLGVKVTINGDKSELLRNKARFGGNILYGYNTTYEESLQLDEKFGKQTVKKLLVPSKPQSRFIRKIN